MPDGRTFVTDGGVSIDAALVKPATLEKLEKLPPASATLIARHLTSPYDTETALSDLKPGKQPNTFITPTGVILNGNYITLLKSMPVAGRTRLRTKGKTDIVVVVADEKAIGVMMPIQPPQSER